MKKWNKNKTFILITTLYIILFFIPFLIAVLTSFKTNSEFSMVKFQILPQHFTLENYINAIIKIDYLTSLSNTILVSALSTFIVTIISIVIGYTLTFIPFKLKKIIIFILILQIIIPFEIIILPWLDIASRLNLNNTLIILIVPQIISSYGILFMANIFKSIPKNSVKALRMETGNHSKIVRHFILPSSRIHIKVLSLYIILFCWEEFTWPLLVNYSQNKLTLTPTLTRLMSNYVPNYPLYIAASLLITIPFIYIGINLLKETVSRDVEFI